MPDRAAYNAAFRRTLPKSLDDKRDFSPCSLDAIETHILQVYPSIAETRPPQEAKRLDAMARYVAEVFRKHFGGKWKIDCSDKKNAFRGLPQLAGMTAQDVQFCPLALVTASTRRRTGSFLSKIFGNCQRDAR